MRLRKFAIPGTCKRKKEKAGNEKAALVEGRL
jgi:hypothetical protein